MALGKNKDTIKIALSSLVAFSGNWTTRCEEGELPWGHSKSIPTKYYLWILEKIVCYQLIKDCKPTILHLVETVSSLTREEALKNLMDLIRIDTIAPWKTSDDIVKEQIVVKKCCGNKNNFVLPWRVYWKLNYQIRRRRIATYFKMRNITRPSVPNETKIFSFISSVFNPYIKDSVTQRRRATVASCQHPSSWKILKTEIYRKVASRMCTQAV